MRFGASREEAVAQAQARAAQARQPVAARWLDEDMAMTAKLFLALQTQWHRAGMAGAASGLIYASIETVARLLDISMSARRFLDLQMIEQGALGELARQAARAHG
jgi:Phage related hypothetical protein (DUF1799)